MKIFYCIKCIEIMEEGHEICRKIRFLRLLEKVLVYKYLKTKVQEESLHAKELIKVFG